MENRIKHFRKAKKLTQQQLADIVGIHLTNLNKIENGRAIPDLARFRQIADALDTTTSELIMADSDDSASDTISVPLLAKISAGLFRSQDGVSPADIDRHIKVTGLPKGDWFALTVDGDSMNRTAPNGSVIIVNRAEDVLLDRAFYVFSLDDGEATFKRFSRDPEPILMPYSFSPDYPSITVGNRDLYVFGRVRRVITDL